MNNKAIFLDRDGVINEAEIKNGKPYPPASLTELRLTPHVKQALQRLKSLGYLLIVATNQPDVARGTVERSLVEAIHAQLRQDLPLDDIRVCYHDDADACTCRKPLPGLLLQAAQDYEIVLEQSVMIGDRWKDIEAGQRAGCKTIWLNKYYQETKPKSADFITTGLLEAATWIEKESKKCQIPSH